MGEKNQFDYALGGDEVLPNTIKRFDFVNSRSQEIAALTEAIEDPLRIIRVPQKLPKHMQRRIMSHNAKRLPRRFRDSHIDMVLKSGVPSESKRPRRKYRRRPQNLLAEYNRRQRTFVWLETHIWHAKRFHMTEKWGYKIANFPNNKSYRACYRACKSHCILQDISYYVCIEVKGIIDNILSGLNQLTSTQCGPTFGAKCALDGSRERSVAVFRRKEYPNGMIGNVKFLWKPVDKNCQTRTLWIWSHPSYSQELLDQIVGVFGLHRNESTPMITDVEVDSKLELRNVPFCKVPTYNSNNGDITVSLLKDTLNRFRLIGPLSQPILTDALKVVNSDLLHIHQSGQAGSDETPLQTNWVHTMYKTKERISCLKKKEEYWEKMKEVTNPGQLPSNCVLPLVVSDPRYHMPEIRTKKVSDSRGPDCKMIIKTAPAEFVEDNPLWDPSVRDSANECRLSTAQLTEIQSKKLVPGACDLDHIAPPSHLPVLLIQNPGCQAVNKKGSAGFGSGWDIVIPAGWSMPLWLCLVWRGARVGGLRESAALQRESGLVPMLPPDSKAGQVEEKVDKQTRMEEFFRKPPGKRPNFLKLGVTSPFCCAWPELLRDWNGADTLPSSFCVLRDRALLEKLCLKLENMKKRKTLSVNDDNIDIGLEKSTFLVAVNVTVQGRGTLSEYSHVCVPKKEDLQMLEKNKSFMGPTEPSNRDPNKKERQKSRKKHLKLLTLLKKRRKVCREKNDWESLKLLNAFRDIEVSEEGDQIKELWLPEDMEHVKDSCSREVMGFVTSGDFSFKEACSNGQAYVALTALLQYYVNWKGISETANPIVLVRLPSSYQYTFAEMSVILNS